MSEKTPTEKLRELLNEMGVEYDTSEDDTTIFYIDGNRYTYNVNPESGWAQLYGYNLTPEQAIAATVGKDIEHYDGSGRRATVAILQGGRKPEEVLFVPVEGGVTHYLPEGVGTCHLEECEHERKIPHDLTDCDGGWYTEVTHDCDECGYENADPNIRFCGGCGRRVVSE